MTKSKKFVETLSREEWAGLSYPVEVNPIAPEEGGGWTATIPMLGEAMFVGDGETAVEALSDLEARRLRYYDLLVESGRPIPVPTYDVEEEEALPSGRWVMRTSGYLHAKLQSAAAASGESLNSYCKTRLEAAVTTDQVALRVEETLQAMILSQQRQNAQFEYGLAFLSNLCAKLVVVALGSPHPNDIVFVPSSSVGGFTLSTSPSQFTIKN